MENKQYKTNLRWPGGKSKMTKILDKYFPETVDKFLEVFTGGASVLLYIIQKYNPQIVYANDIDSKLINFFNAVKDSPITLMRECLEVKNRYTAETFREAFKDLDREKASHFFIANKTSFSGLNYNYSQFAYDRNFSHNSIRQIANVSEVIQNTIFLNEDFVNLENVIENIEDFFIYLDPPYYGNKQKGLYGKKGLLHKQFDHETLFEWVDRLSKKNRVMLSYDDCEYVRELYKDYNIYTFGFTYSMTNAGGNLCKEGQEIVITNYDVKGE